MFSGIAEPLVHCAYRKVRDAERLPGDCLVDTTRDIAGMKLHPGREPEILGFTALIDEVVLEHADHIGSLVERVI